MGQIKQILKYILLSGRKYFILLFLLFLLLFSVRFYAVGYGIGGDGNYYYMYLPSVIIDHDLDFKNQYLSTPRPIFPNNFTYTNLTMSITYTKTGYVENVFPIGSAILWSPFFIFSLFLIYILNIFGLNISTADYSLFSQYFTMIGSIFYATLGFFLAFKLIKELKIQPLIIKYSIAILLLGSFLIQYVAIEPSMSHANDFFIVTLFFYFFYVNFIATNNSSLRKWAALGIISALMIMVRPQNAVFLVLVPIYYAIISLKNNCFLECVKKELMNFLIFFGFCIIFLTPLLLTWKILYGSYLIIPQGPDFLKYFSPKIFEVLFSFRHSLFVSTPILFISFIGLIMLLKNHEKEERQYNEKIFIYILLLAFAFQLYINSIIVGDWWGGDALGARRFSGLFLIFIIGFSYFLEKIQNLRWSYIVYILLFIIVFLNFLYFVEYNTNIISRNEAVTYLQILRNFPQLINFI